MFNLHFLLISFLSLNDFDTLISVEWQKLKWIRTLFILSMNSNGITFQFVPQLLRFNVCRGWEVVFSIRYSQIQTLQFIYLLITHCHPQGDERKVILKTFIINLHNSWNSNSSSTPPDKTSVFFLLFFLIARRSNALQANCWSFNSCLPRLCFVNGWRKWN